MRIGIVGVGGIGGWLAARILQSQSAEVVLIARGQRGAALKKRGLKLTVRDPSGGNSLQLQFEPKAAEVYDSVAEALAQGAKPLNYCFLCVKTWQVKDAAVAAYPFLAARGCLVTTQNGVLAPSVVAEATSRSSTVAGICRAITFVSQDLEGVDMLASPADIRIGEAYDSEGKEAVDPNSERVTAITSLLSGCEGISCNITQPSAWSELWMKAAASASFSVAALCRAPLDVLAQNPESSGLLKGAIGEAVRCGRAAGHVTETEEEIVERHVSYFSKIEPGTTPSTLRDVLIGCPSEMRELLGGIRQAGASLGVATPVHDFVYAALLPQELRARGVRPYTLLGVPGGAPHVLEADPPQQQSNK